MVRTQTLLLIVALAFLALTSTSVNGQCYTHCISGGCCSSSHPQCCVVNGIKLCCNFRLVRGRSNNADADESTSPRLGFIEQ